MVLLERSIRRLISLRGSPRGPFFLAAWSMVSGDIEVDADMFPDVQWHSTVIRHSPSPFWHASAMLWVMQALPKKLQAQHSSSACHRSVEYFWKFDSADVTCWCLWCLLKQNWSWALWPKVSWFLRSRCKLWHVLMYLLQEHSHGWQKIHRYHQHSVQMGNVGKLSVNETASYTLSYTLPCLPEQLQEPTWPAEGLLPHRLGHMGCTLRWSTWAWAVLGGEHQRKALLPKWQGPWWTQQQNCRVQLHKVCSFSCCGRCPGAFWVQERLVQIEIFWAQMVSSLEPTLLVWRPPGRENTRDL